jgi:phage tail-like protein
MDVNGTRFHLLLGKDDFARRCQLERELASDEGTFSWDRTRNELTLGGRVFTFRSAPQNEVPRLEQRRGAAVDAYGHVYWIDGNEIHPLRSAGAAPPLSHSDFTDLNPAIATKLELSGLAITKEHYLAAGVLDPPGLLIFDLQTGAAPRQLRWPAGVDFTPFDMAATADGGVVILDRAHGNVWQLDRAFRVVPASALVPHVEPTPPLFTPVDGSAPAAEADATPRITAALALHTGLTDLVSIEVIRDSSILLMRSRNGDSFSSFHRYKDGAATGEPLSTKTAKEAVDHPSAFKFLGHDFAYVAERSGVNEPAFDVLYVAGGAGDQAIAFEIVFRADGKIELEVLHEYHPMRLFSGKALIASGGDALYDLRERWVPLVAQRRNAFVEESTFTVIFDGKEPDCTWHRLFLDACIPAGCGVVVRSRAANRKDLLSSADETEEPPLRQRTSGSEMPWTDDVNGTWELLFQRAEGRWLQLSITLRGNGRNSPRVRSLRAYYPRFSYRDHYLPQVYREDAESAWFLDRFLALFEGFFTAIEERIAAAQCLFDVRCAPAEALDWLASWFAVALDPAWDERKRRLFIKHAVDFFAWRGTIPGLLMALRLVTEENPGEDIFDVACAVKSSAVRIAEKFRNRAIPTVLLNLKTPVVAEGLPVRPREAQWQPAHGAAELDQRFAAFSGDSAAVFRAGAAKESAAFARMTLGFVPRATNPDTPLWQRHLARRYASIDDLNLAWATSYAAFSDIPLPPPPPHAAAALSDWIRFEAIVLPARDAAHRFTVFLPQRALGITDRQKQIDLARRVVALEKPAHTTFDVQFYWAWFRVGEARIGSDTVVDRGGASPELFGPFVLDRSYAGSGYLAPEPARAARDRILLGASTPRKGEMQ